MNVTHEPDIVQKATFALIQMSCGTDPDENRERAVAKIQMAAKRVLR